MKYTKNLSLRKLLALICSIANKIFDLAPPYLIATGVDIVVRRENSILGNMGVTDLTTQLVILAALTLVIWILESLFEFFYRILWRNLAQDVQHHFRMDAYKHIQKLEMAYFENRQTGGIMSILNDDVNQLERFLDTGANEMIQVVVTVIVISTSFFFLSSDVAILGLLPMPFVILFAVKYQKFLRSKYAAVREEVGHLNGILSNNLTGISTIKSYTTEEYESGRINKASDNYREANRNAIFYSSGFIPLIRMIIVVGFTLILIFGGLKAIAGTMEVAAYSAMVFLTQRLLWPLTGLGNTFDLFQRAMASVNRILGLLERQPAILPGKHEKPLEQYKGDIEFQNISFQYPDRPQLFENFSVSIKAGENVAFVGPTGSGKSTIVKLLLRFYEPQHGQIILDGKPLNEYSLTNFRKAIGLVKQDTFIIDGTIKENIAYGVVDMSMEKIIDAAKLAEIHEFVQSLPQAYETMVGEGGQKLSGGQKQRVAIARAVLKNPPILVLDEATSSVDNETEAAIQRSLNKLIQGRTTIIIAHRLSTIRHAHQIYVIDQGRISESGTHDDLVKQKGQYAKLWQVQTGEALIFKDNEITNKGADCKSPDISNQQAAAN